MGRYIRKHLSFKLFLSYLIVIMVGIIVLGLTAELAVPAAFAGHLASMRTTLGHHMMGGLPAELEQDLFSSFQTAVTRALITASLAAVGIAALTSFFVSRQVVAPLQAMTAASQRIAEGHYAERVRVPGDIARYEPDELGQLALSFNQMAFRLEQTEAMRRQLIADVSHELRTPLTTIKGSMEGLIDGVLPADAETFQQIYREADRLQRLVNDLQELSRVEAGAFELHLEAVHAETLVQAVVSRLQRQFEEKGVSLEIEIQPGLPPVMADEDRIGQVLLNLLGNALQYTPAGGKVAVIVTGHGQEVTFAILDTGVGIHPEHLPHVFTRFFRVDQSRSRSGGGSGIGLTIARHLVEAHAGRIWVESAGLDEGSAFAFTLPAVAFKPEALHNL